MKRYVINVPTAVTLAFSTLAEAVAYVRASIVPNGISEEAQYQAALEWIVEVEV